MGFREISSRFLTLSLSMLKEDTSNFCLPEATSDALEIYIYKNKMMVISNQIKILAAKHWIHLSVKEQTVEIKMYYY